MNKRYPHGAATVARILMVTLACAVWPLLKAETIGKVSIVTKVSNVDLQSIEQIVLGNIKSVPGRPFDPAALVDDIHRLHETGVFEVGVTYQKKSLPDGKAEIIWFLTPKRRIREIRFDGNHSIRTKRLLAEVGQAVGEPLDRVQLAKDRNAILDRYRSAGYYGTKVTVEVIDADDAHECTIVFHIKEAPRVQLKKVLFQGNTAYETRTLRRRIFTKRPWWRYIFRWSNYFNREMLDADKDILRDMYAEKGYLDFKVEKIETQYDKKKKWVTVIFHLHEGPVYTVSAVDLQGNQRFGAEELLKLIRMQPKHVYSSTTEQADLKTIRGKY
jgi:outer membrane protein insertion porin family